MNSTIDEDLDRLQSAIDEQLHAFDLVCAERDSLRAQVKALEVRLGIARARKDQARQALSLLRNAALNIGGDAYFNAEPSKAAMRMLREAIDEANRVIAKAEGRSSNQQTEGTHGHEQPE